MNYTDAVDMSNSVTRDIARWHLDQNPRDPVVDDLAVDDWIYEVQISATLSKWRPLCEQYWEDYFSPSPG